MKLEPRVRAKTALYEMDRDSGYLLVFKTKGNAHLYGKNPTTPAAKKAKAAAAKAAKKAQAAAAKKAAAPSAKKTAAKNAPVAKKSATPRKKTSANLSSAFAAVSAPPPLTKQQSQTATQLARQGSQTHRWEFVDDKGGWSRYNGEASKLVEMEYQAWQQQPSVFVRSVRSGDWHYSVNFTKMEQTNINHPNHRVRKIRRAANF